MEPRSALLVRCLVFSSCLLLLAASGSASTLEDATAGSVSYQFDGGSHHDAPDACPDASTAWSLPVEGQTDGLLVAPDDTADAYAVEIPRSLVGKRLALTVAEPTGAQELTLDAFTPGCQGSILDMVNWPTPDPSPPAPGPGETQVALASSAPEHCEPRQWVFILDEMSGLPAPPTIHVAWTDGSEQTVDLWQGSSQFAVYPTNDRLDITIKGAWANLPLVYGGDLRLVLGPCDASDGGAVYGGAPTLGDGLLSFTPTQAGTHVVLVSLAGAPSVPSPALVDPAGILPVAPHDAVEPVADSLGLGHSHSSSSLALTIPTVSPDDVRVTVPGVYAPMTCHFCLGGAEDAAEKVSYLLRSSRST